MGDAAFELLKEEFQDEDIFSKKRGAEKLNLVAKSLGAEKVRSELLPWLDNRITGKYKRGDAIESPANNAAIDSASLPDDEKPKEDDEVLYLFAEKLCELTQYVGGAEYYWLLLTPLTHLACVEETCVRNKAVESALVIIKLLPRDQLKDGGVKMFEALANGDWFTDRVSACGLVAGLMRQLLGDSSNGIPDDAASEYQVLRNTYVSLCKDATPMVKRAAAKELGNVAAVWDGNTSDEPGEASDSFTNDILKGCYYPLLNDAQESVRIIAIGQTAKICKCLSKQDSKKTMFPFVQGLCEDSSWRVRFTISTEFATIAKSMDDSTADAKSPSSLMILFANLLKDPEAEVRSAACKEILDLIDTISSGIFVDFFLPILIDLVQVDTQPRVRQILADVSINPKVISMVKEADESKGVEKLLLPIWENFFFHETLTANTLKLLSGLDSIGEATGTEFLVGPYPGWGDQLKIMYKNSKAREPAATGMNENCDEIEHPQWRIRKAILLSLDKLAKAKWEVAEEFIIDTWTMALSDEVYAVRMTAASLLGNFCSNGSNIGLNRVIDAFIPKLIAFYDNDAKGKKEGGKANYLYRLVFLEAASQLASYPDAWNLVSGAYGDCFSDKVPNIRLKAISLLEDMPRDVVDSFQPKLAQLMNDCDPDVKQAAESYSS